MLLLLLLPAAIRYTGRTRAVPKTSRQTSRRIERCPATAATDAATTTATTATR